MGVDCNNCAMCSEIFPNDGYGGECSCGNMYCEECYDSLIKIFMVNDEGHVLDCHECTKFLGYTKNQYGLLDFIIKKYNIDRTQIITEFQAQTLVEPKCSICKKVGTPKDTYVCYKCKEVKCTNCCKRNISSSGWDYNITCVQCSI